MSSNHQVRVRRSVLILETEHAGTQEGGQTGISKEKAKGRLYDPGKDRTVAQLGYT